VPGSNGHPHKTARSQQSDNAAPPPAQPAAAFTPPSVEAVIAEFERMVAANQAKFVELAAQGAAPDPLFMVHARINHLIDAIAQATGPNGPRWAAMTRLGFEKYIAAELEQAGPATRRMQLAEGARYTPAMIAALARQTGTFRRTQ
jgi:hypothetical protein